MKVVWWMSFWRGDIIFFYLNFLFFFTFFNFVLYFFFQEILGLIFLINLNLFVGFLILLGKRGLGPFFFWLVFFVRIIENFSFFWFIIFKKLIFFPVFYFYLLEVFFLMVFGLILVYLGLFFILREKLLIFFSSVESGNLILLIIRENDLEFLFFLFWYFLFFQRIFFQEIFDFILLEFYFYFFNLPASFSFYFKIFLVGELVLWNLLFLVFIVVIFFLVFFVRIIFFFNITGVCWKNFNLVILFLNFFWFIFLV